MKPNRFLGFFITCQHFRVFGIVVPALFLFLSPASFSQEISTDPAVIAAGESLFSANCKSCHRVKKTLIGPALAGVYDRAPSIDWIKNFVRNSSKVIAGGDEYANALYEEYDNTMMTSFTSFTDDQIMSILAYVKAEADKPDETVAASGGGNGGGEQGSALPSSYINIILLGMGLILALILTVLVLIVNILKKYLDQKKLTEDDREIVHSPYSLSTVVRSSGFVFLVVFIVVAVSFKSIIDGLYSVGVQQGYAPAQPIAFSHKIHAGQYGIECQYCHTGVTKSRSATIPSANVCMNCHTQIRRGTNTGESEIAKIVSAVETNTPIEWVRVHNLPDLAYFNHAQHVNVGGIACQTCHGPIEEMDLVKQHASLTMGWCIDCHRNTNVNMKGNRYYDNVLQAHLGAGLKVEDIGGLECAKCHY